MKKFSFLIIPLLALSITACKQEQPTPETSTTTEAQENTTNNEASTSEEIQENDDIYDLNLDNARAELEMVE